MATRVEQSGGAAADGLLAEWAGIPPVPVERFNIGLFPDRAKRQR